MAAASIQAIALTVIICIRYHRSLRQVEDLLFERGIDIYDETVRFWSNRFGPMFVAEIRLTWPQMFVATSIF